MPTPNLSVLLVQGVLVFADDVPQLSLDAEYVFVFGGVFEVGTEAAPFTNKATITLHGTQPAPANAGLRVVIQDYVGAGGFCPTVARSSLKCTVSFPSPPPLLPL